MDEIQSEAFGFDFRGPASSEALNEFLESTNSDMGALIQNTFKLRNEFQLLANQTTKQTLALTKKLGEVSPRDSGSNCKADLSDSTVVLTTDKDGYSITPSERLVHRMEYGAITPPVTKLNWLAREGTDRKYPADGVVFALESITEGGTQYNVPMEYAFAGDNSVFFERMSVAGSPQGTAQSISLFYGIPLVRNGSGYPNSNYICFIPYPLYTIGYRVWYTLDTSPVLTVAGSTWYDWGDTYESLHHASVFSSESGPLYTSFPTDEITAVRIDIEQPFYLVEDANYVYSYGLGGLEIGLSKTTTTTAKGTVKITKPSGSFASVATDAGNVDFDNVSSGDYDDVVSTYSWKDPVDDDIAYVEITLLPNATSDGQIPVIKEVSVDYT